MSMIDDITDITSTPKIPLGVVLKVGEVKDGVFRILVAKFPEIEIIRSGRHEWKFVALEGLSESQIPTGFGTVGETVTLEPGMIVVTHPNPETVNYVDGGIPINHTFLFYVLGILTTEALNDFISQNGISIPESF